MCWEHCFTTMLNHRNEPSVTERLDGTADNVVVSSQAWSTPQWSDTVSILWARAVMSSEACVLLVRFSVRNIQMEVAKVSLPHLKH